MMINHDGANNIPNIEALNEAYLEIDRHNRKHTGLGALLGGVISAVTEEAVSLGEDADASDIYAHVNESLENHKEEGDMHGELQEIIHGDLMSRAGIKVVPSGGQVFGGERKVSSAKLIPVIDNSSMFAEFLKSIEPSSLRDGNDKLLTELAGSLKSRIDTAFSIHTDMSSFSDEEKQAIYETGEDALRTWSEVEEDYYRLGFSGDQLRQELHDSRDESKAKRKLFIFSSLEGYVDYWGKGLLPEYIEATQKGYIVPPEECYYWHPARWAEDMGAEDLSEKWESVMDFVDGLRGKQSSNELMDHCIAILGPSIDASIQDMIIGEKYDQEGFDKALAEWKEHGEQPYKDPRYKSLNVTIKHPPAKEDYSYYRNNRIILEAVKLRFDQIQPRE